MPPALYGDRSYLDALSGELVLVTDKTNGIEQRGILIPPLHQGAEPPYGILYYPETQEIDRGYGKRAATDDDLEFINGGYGVS